MQTLDEAIEKKQATVYLDTKPEFVDAIHRYNKKMWVGREKRDRLNRIGKIYCLVNPILVIVLFLLRMWFIILKVLDNQRLATGGTDIFFIGAALNIAAYFFFAVHKENYIVAAIISFTLLYLYPGFLPLVIFNVVMSIVYQWHKIRLKDMQGYPVFEDIQISYRTYKEHERKEGSLDDDIFNERNNY